MKILLVITSLGMGGAERQVCDLADQFTALGHQIILISMTGETVNLPRSTMVKVVSLNMTKKPLGFVRAYWQARKLIEQFEPDVVHSHMVHANLFVRLLRLSVHFPKLICTAHNTYEGSRIRMLAYRVTDRLCDLSTNVSQEAVDAFIQQGAVPVGRMLAMHNGIDTARFTFDEMSRVRLRTELGLNDDTLLLLAVGRLNVQKDYPNLFSAFSKLVGNYKNLQLAIIGVGEEEDKLVSMVTKLELNERVIFLGLRRDVNDWMSAADLFVLSSAWEGFGLVVAEAMACERVVVATDCGGVKEVIGNSGILVPAKNSAALEIAISQALSMKPIVAKRLGLQAREFVIKNYSLDAVATKWIDLYKQ